MEGLKKKEEKIPLRISIFQKILTLLLAIS